MTPIVIVGDAADAACATLATQLGVALVAAPSALPAGCPAWLGYRESRLQLHPADARQSGPVAVDFCEGAAARRAQGGAELIVKAVRGRSRLPLRVLDATAGLGRDAFVLASRGFDVVALEREPVIAALLADGLARARTASGAAAEAAVRIALHCADAVDYLAALPAAERPDVVYLDPMFPPSQKSALVKKEMRLFQQLLHGAATVGTGAEATLLQAALDAARLRVVVKRPAKAAALAGRAPDYALPGKAIRFDVYAGHGAAATA